jgi:hypothetical protein
VCGGGDGRGEGCAVEDEQEGARGEVEGLDRQAHALARRRAELALAELLRGRRGTAWTSPCAMSGLLWQPMAVGVPMAIIWRGIVWTIQVGAQA